MYVRMHARTLACMHAYEYFIRLLVNLHVVLHLACVLITMNFYYPSYSAKCFGISPTETCLDLYYGACKKEKILYFVIFLFLM